MKNVLKNIEKYNLGKNRKIIIVFDDMIGDMINQIKSIRFKKRWKKHCFIKS